MALCTYSNNNVLSYFYGHYSVYYYSSKKMSLVFSCKFNPTSLDSMYVCIEFISFKYQWSQRQRHKEGSDQIFPDGTWLWDCKSERQGLDSSSSSRVRVWVSACDFAVFSLHDCFSSSIRKKKKGDGRLFFFFFFFLVFWLSLVKEERHIHADCIKKERKEKKKKKIRLNASEDQLCRVQDSPLFSHPLQRLQP